MPASRKGECDLGELRGRNLYAQRRCIDAPVAKEIGDLVDWPSLSDELGGKAVAQEMRTCDPPEFDPAMPQPLPHDPRNRRRALERPQRRREGQEQIRTIHFRSSAQDVIGECGAGLLEEWHHPDHACPWCAGRKPRQCASRYILQPNGA
ncbi:hypothetical protein AU467_33555 [Mesorhizobium loti]|uniref:Uncharacterized protein n=1 Tax=Rhizobium loti TaxID=381 RepID=A0A101KM88_RHILI|nr:hypothetical protein AU467_33555 [Mesorhizobium loti]